jgi:hypothetical protein
MTEQEQMRGTLMMLVKKYALVKSFDDAIKEVKR